MLGRDAVSCLHLGDAFDDGQKLLEVVEQLGLEGVVSKRQSTPYRSGERGDWVKVKTAAGREPNRERKRLFERNKASDLRGGHQP